MSARALVRSKLHPGAALAAALLLAVAAPAPAALAAARTVREPAYGLPHIFADTDLELARENGRQVARDRLGQMILVGRVARGTLAQAFGILDPGAIADDIETRRLGYTSSELNRMFEALPVAERQLLLEYCKGVNDTIDGTLSGALPQPIEVSVLGILTLADDLFGNATDVSDQVDPYFAPPGGEWPTSGFQFTPEIAIAIGVLQVRNFGLGGFSEELFAELQELIALQGASDGPAVWDDRRFLNDPLAPVSVPDPTTPGFGGPLASVRLLGARRLAQRFPTYDYAAIVEQREARHAARAERAQRLGAWPKLGSYAWVMGPGKSATGNPWLGGFPQTGELTPSIMHYVENRSAEPGGIRGNGMEFIGAPLVLIGHTDQVAWTTTTAQLPVVDTVFEQIVLEDADAIRYVDEGTPAPLSLRTERFYPNSTQPPVTRVFWRSHARNGDGGSRPVSDFLGDLAGVATGGSETQLEHADAIGVDLAGGHVAIVGGPGAGQIRAIAAVVGDDAIQVTAPFTTPPGAGSEYVAVGPGGTMLAVAADSAAWLEESTTVLGFAKYQRATSILDIRAGVRLIPTTHNFFAADSLPFEGIGTDPGQDGNIGYWSSGFSRVRQDASDLRLPVDGAGPNPLVVVSGTIDVATSTTLTASGAFSGRDFSPPALNARYDDPATVPSEWVVTVRSATGHKQSRRIASNTANRLVVESPFGLQPAPGDAFEVQEVLGMPEAVNPAEGFTANWNNKAATADPGDGFGRNHRVAFILERIAADDEWDRAKQRQLNADLAGLDGRGRFGRYLIPRLRQAVDAVGNGGEPAVDTVLAQLEAWNGAPEFGRNFVDPVADTTLAGEVTFLKDLFAALGQAIYADEFGALGVPGGSDGEALVIHAIDAAAGDVSGSRPQSFTGDYFGGVDWKVVVRDALAALAAVGIPADGVRPERRFDHPLAALDPSLSFPPIPAGNRGTYEQIVEVGPTVRGEFIFPLGQSAHIEGSIGGVAAIDPNVTTLHPIWRDWRFVPMLSVSADLATALEGDSDGDGVLDGYERWYFGNLDRDATDDTSDLDGLDLLGEFLAGAEPDRPDTDGDGELDGVDPAPQDRLVVPEAGALLQSLAALSALAGAARRRGPRARG